MNLHEFLGTHNGPYSFVACVIYFLILFLYASGPLCAQVSEPLTLASTRFGHPQIAVDGSHVVVLWPSYQASAHAEAALLFRWSADGGMTFASPRKLTRLSDFAGELSTVINATDASFHLCWSDTGRREAQRANHADVYYSRVDLTTGESLVPINLSDTPGDSEYCQVSASGNVVAVLWYEDNSSPDQRLLLSYSVDGGRTFTPPQEITRMGRVNVSGIATTPENICLVWSRFVPPLPLRDEGVYFLRHDISQRDLSSTTILKLSDAGSPRPSVVASSNRVVVVWRDQRLLSAISDNGGRTFAAPSSFATRPSTRRQGDKDQPVPLHNPRMAFSQDDLYLIGENVESGQSRTYYFFSLRKGEHTFSSLHDVSVLSGPYQEHQLLAIPGSVIVGWGEKNGNYLSMHYQISRDGGKEFAGGAITPINARLNEIGGLLGSGGLSSYAVKMAANSEAVYYTWLHGQSGLRMRSVMLLRVPFQKS